MKALEASLLLSLVCAAPVVAQERDRSLERISLALQQPLPTIRGVDDVESVAPKTFGIFTLVPPQGRGEFVRISVPIGELVSQGLRAVATAARRRQEAVARRQVEADLEWFANQAERPSRGSAGVSSRNW
jgi:hypothetical protein